MRRVFKTKTFDRWVRRVGLKDSALRVAVTEMLSGQIDAHSKFVMAVAL